MSDNQWKEQHKIFGLDLMRVLAILLVLAAHILWIYHDHSNLLTKAINFSGFVGVELFFVLSGFLIGRSLLKLFLNPDYDYRYASIFLRRRWFRIMPNYLLVLILNIAVFSYLGYQIQDAWKYFFFLQNFIHPMLPFFPESWSMSIKEIPYFVLPFAFLLLARFKNINRNAWFAWTMVALIAAVTLAKISYHRHIHAYSLQDWNVSLRSVAMYRIDAVLLGILAGWVQYNYLAWWTRMVWISLVLSQLLLGALAYLVGFLKLPMADYPVFWNLLFLPLISIASALMLPFFSQWKSGPDRLRKPVQFLGAISYSVYLLHYSFVLYLMKYFIDTYYMDLWQLHTFTLLYLAVTFVLSWCLYEFYERPLMKIREEKI